MGRAEGPGRDQRGSGTVLVVAVVGIVLAVTMGGLGVAAWFHAAQRAATAADLGALAAANAHVRGDPHPCAAATSAIRSNGSDLDGCRVLPDDSVQVSTTCAVRRVVPVGPGQARGVARAGPAPVGEMVAPPTAARDVTPP